ncbi:MAG: hypothetical protein IJK52_05685 [Oscillospiraceae bacterium]|nr:hypothetical protein [Oscillospiraceae bacterium]
MGSGNCLDTRPCPYYDKRYHESFHAALFGRQFFGAGYETIHRQRRERRRETAF